MLGTENPIDKTEVLIKRARGDTILQNVLKLDNWHDSSSSCEFQNLSKKQV